MNVAMGVWFFRGKNVRSVVGARINGDLNLIISSTEGSQVCDEESEVYSTIPIPKHWPRHRRCSVIRGVCKCGEVHSLEEEWVVEGIVEHGAPPSSPEHEKEAFYEAVIKGLKWEIRSRDEELMRVRTQCSAAAHILDNIAIECGLSDRSPLAVQDHIRELRKRANDDRRSHRASTHEVEF